MPCTTPETCFTSDELRAGKGTTEERIEDIYERLDLFADKTAAALAHLAVAIVELHRPTRWDRFKQWFRDNVYDGEPVRFTYVPGQDDRSL